LAATLELADQSKDCDHSNGRYSMTDINTSADLSVILPCHVGHVCARVEAKKARQMSGLLFSLSLH